MKILLDESLPKRLKNDFKAHRIFTVPEMGWQGKKNGELLALMSDKFDVFITADQNLQYQLNLRNTSITIIILAAPTNRYADLKPLVTKTLNIFKNAPLKESIVRVS